MRTHTCLKCKHQWESRILKRPKKCPHCFNANWHKPRKARKKPVKA
jgi:DNA-directed RNA polymerase subunit RPC12/RpoP